MCDANFWKHIKVKGRENRPQDVSQDVRFEEMVILKWTEKKRKKKLPVVSNGSDKFSPTLKDEACRVS